MKKPKKKSRKSKRKEERKKLLKSMSTTDVEWVADMMEFYDNHYDLRWFYNDWVKAGRPTY